MTLHRFILPAALAALSLSACASIETTKAPTIVDPLGAGPITSLPGVRYKIIKSGAVTGGHPSRGDDIVVRYEGRLLDGKVFDSSASDKNGTAVFPLGKLIPGWVCAVQLMRPGDEWLIQTPAYMAYGDKGVGPIPPGSDLIFKVELVSFSPHKGG